MSIKDFQRLNIAQVNYDRERCALKSNRTLKRLETTLNGLWPKNDLKQRLYSNVIDDFHKIKTQNDKLTGAQRSRMSRSQVDIIKGMSSPVGDIKLRATKFDLEQKSEYHNCHAHILIDKYRSKLAKRPNKEVIRSKGLKTDLMFYDLQNVFHTISGQK